LQGSATTPELRDQLHMYIDYRLYWLHLAIEGELGELFKM
jgi:hypothetical protein